MWVLPVLLFLMLKLFFPAPVKWLLSDLSEFCFSPSFCFVFQPQQVVQKKPAQVRKNDLNSLRYLKLNTSPVFKVVKSVGECINSMKWRIAAGLLGTTTQKIHVVALRKERRQQWKCNLGGRCLLRNVLWNVILLQPPPGDDNTATHTSGASPAWARHPCVSWAWAACRKRGHRCKTLLLTDINKSLNPQNKIGWTW